VPANINQLAQALPELLLPLSYSHLLLSATLLLFPFAGLGLGLSMPPPKIDVLAPKLFPNELGDPNDPSDDLRAPFMAF
jgi:hypothetical protein